MELRLLVDLDMFLDTRIATVSRLSEDAAIDLLTPDYRHRLSDELGLLTDKITTEEFKEAYRMRDKYTLFKAAATPMNFIFGRSIRDHIDTMRQTKKFTKISIDINIHPYDLTEDEKVAIIDCFMTYGGVEAHYRCVTIRHFELTLKRIKDEGYSGIFMYDFATWAEAHIEKLKEDDPLMPSCVFTVPRLVKSVEEYKANPVTKLPDGTEVDPFQAMRIVLSSVIGVQAIPVEHVSLIELPPDIFESVRT